MQINCIIPVFYSRNILKLNIQFAFFCTYSMSSASASYSELQIRSIMIYMFVILLYGFDLLVQYNS